MANTVRCADCGLLAQQKREGSLEPAEPEYRETGWFKKEQDWQRYKELPICCARRRRFSEEIDYPVKGLGVLQEQTRAALSKGIDCDSFVFWTPGLSIKDHIDMTILKQQQEFYRQCRVEDQRFRQEEEQKNQEWRDRQEAKADKRHKRELLVFGLVLGLLTILAAFIERGYFFPLVQPTQIPPSATADP